MNLYICCGKGGVGKTTSAAAIALRCSMQTLHRTAIIDYDGGHSVKSVLGLPSDALADPYHAVRPNLSAFVVEPPPYEGIAACKAAGRPLSDYLAQFPGDLGIIPLADMVGAFFGVPTDVSALSKFAALVTVLERLQGEGYLHVVIDVEPTAGLERLFSHAATMTQSLLNLRKQGILSLAFLAAKWPDIAGYLKGDFIRQADWYAARIERTVAAMRGATYLLVATPEAGPVSQTHDVRRIIMNFGGRVDGYVVNNVRGEPHELAHIERLRNEGLPLVAIARDPNLHIEGFPDRIASLERIGDRIVRGIFGTF